MVCFFKRYLPKSFFLRSLLILLTPVGLIHLISGWIFFHRHWENTCFLLADHTALALTSLVDIATHQGLAQAQKFAQSDLFIDRSSYVPSPSVIPFFSERLTQRLFYPFSITKSHYWIRVWVKTPWETYVFRFATKRLIPRTPRLFLFWALGSSFIFLFIAGFVMRQQVRPLVKLARWTQELEKEYPSLLPQIRGAREIRNLATAFEKTMQRIRQGFQERHQMLLGISHDLRTPLSRMKLTLHMMDSIEEVHELQKDVAEMQAMIESYLTFANNEQEPCSLVVLLSLVQNIVDQFSSSLLITLDIACDLAFWTKPLAFSRCLRNLLDNARQYGGFSIYIHAWIEGSSVVISLEDDGPGIDPSHDKAIFTPFFRLEAHRPFHGQSGGLGLSIVKNIMKDLGGSITIEKGTKLKGAAFHLILPFGKNPS